MHPPGVVRMNTRLSRATIRSIPIMQEEAGYPVIIDATHSAQMPGNKGHTTGGFRKYIPTILKAAIAAGCNGIFMEVHDDVENAKSDAATDSVTGYIHSQSMVLMLLKYLFECWVKNLFVFQVDLPAAQGKLE